MRDPFLEEQVSVQVSLEYSGRLGQEPAGSGFYLSDSYDEGEGEERVNVEEGVIEKNIMEKHIIPLYHDISLLFKGDLRNISRMWSTKFEPAYARQMFPCMDEPDIRFHFKKPPNSHILLLSFTTRTSSRAVFEVKVGRPKDYMSISNMPKVRGKSSRNRQNANIYILVFFLVQRVCPPLD